MQLRVRLLHQGRFKPSLFNPATLLALGIAAAASFGFWDATNQPKPVPSFSGDVAGMAFSPYHRGETPETQSFPSVAEVRDSLQKAAAVTGRIRTYTVQAGMAGHRQAGKWIIR